MAREENEADEMNTSELVREQELKAIRQDIARLEKELEEERKRSDEYLTNLRYERADSENFRKRVDREIRELEEFSTLGLVRKLIPILDDLDLAVASATKAEDKGFLEGVKMVQKNLTSVLEGEGLRRIKAVGEPFNPSTHEAVDKVEGKGVDEDTVVEEMRTGYTFKGKVLRPSAVKVEVARPQKEGEA
ncbi:MAG TPA: nucleotide exchange factor GrpE [Nitrososphaerales archaeon]|nr:nucleotide exchange factor GrpE [Nitrososphaerales archaeon]